MDTRTSRHRLSRARRGFTDDGFTLIELLIVVAMIGVLATIAFPLLLRARMSANEGSAIASLRAMHSAQAAFGSSCGSGNYAGSLDDLAVKPPLTSVAFIEPPYVANGAIHSGYIAEVMPASGSNAGITACSGVDTVSMYVGERHPVTVGVTGVRSFAVDTDGTLFMRNDGLEIDDAMSGAVILK